MIKVADRREDVCSLCFQKKKGFQAAFKDSLSGFFCDEDFLKHAEKWKTHEEERERPLLKTKTG